MGICSSKDKGAAGSSSSSQKAAAAAAAPVGETPAQGSAHSLGTDAPAYPSTPHQSAAADADADGTPQMHTYDSNEKPVRSAMRNSIDVGGSNAGRSLAPTSASGGGYQRGKTSTSLASSVGFNVTVDAPDAENRDSHLHAADSISLKKIVDMFYDKLVADGQVGHFFKNIDIQKLKNHQVRFMALAFGGKELVFEEDPHLNLRKVHYKLIKDRGLTLEHWQRFVDLFEETMEALSKEVPQQARDAARRSIQATKHYFVPIGEETEFTNSSIAALPVQPAA